MHRLARSAVAIAFVTLALASGCSGGGGGASAPPPSGGDSSPPPSSPRTATPLPDGSPRGVTAFAQTVPAQLGTSEVFPGQANSWVLDRDFALAQGFGLQFSSALELFTGSPTAPVSHASVTDDLAVDLLDSFPYDQDAAEVVFLTPPFTADDGVRTAAASDGASMGVASISGGRSGYVNGTSDSRLARTLSVAPETSYTLAWKHRVYLHPGNLLGESVEPYAPFYRVVLRDVASGAILQTLFSRTSILPMLLPQAASAALPAGLPAQVELSFEIRSGGEGYVEIDDVVLSDGSGPVASFANGDFEAADLAPWRANLPAESQNVRSGTREVGPLAGPKLGITRTFYAPPSATWARFVDVFENLGSSPVSTTVVYRTSLAGVTPAAVVSAGGKAIVGWDRSGDPDKSRDVGIVLGAGTALVDSASPDVYALHEITVPAGGKVALAHFVVQLGKAEGGSGPAQAPAATDAACAAIASSFRTDPQLQLDLEPGVLDAIANF